MCGCVRAALVPLCEGGATDGQPPLCVMSLGRASPAPAAHTSKLPGAAGFHLLFPSRLLLAEPCLQQMQQALPCKCSRHDKPLRSAIATLPKRQFTRKHFRQESHGERNGLSAKKGDKAATACARAWDVPEPTVRTHTHHLPQTMRQQRKIPTQYSPCSSGKAMALEVADLRPGWGTRQGCRAVGLTYCRCCCFPLAGRCLGTSAPRHPMADHYHGLPSHGLP